MKKNQKHIAILVSVILTVVSLSGCSESKQTQGAVKEQEKRNVKQELTFTEYDFLSEGASEYIILIPDTPTTNETFAAEELQLFIQEASGVKLDIQKEGESQAEKYLSVGATEVAKQANVTPTYDEVLNNGFLIRTIEDDCYLIGYSDIGTRNSIYEFLYQCFDYECYAADEICMVETTELRLPDFAITMKPSFEWREATGGATIYDAVTSYRMRFNQNEEIFVTGHLTHNSMTIVNPLVYDYTSQEYKSWYSEALAVNPLPKTGERLPAQLCYSNKDMEKVYIENLIQLLEDSDASVMLMGMEDNVEWCTCAECSASKEKYGTNSAVIIQFANRVQEAVNQWFAKNHPDREPTKLIFFAYYETVMPPVTYDAATDTYKAIDDSVMLHEDLGVMYAPIGASYAHTLTDARNKEAESAIRGWNALTDNIYTWLYSLHPSHAFIMIDTFEVMQENYQFLLENGTTFLYDQTDHYQENGSSSWSSAKTYVMSKLQWNANLNMEELLEDFFANYFDKAGNTMKKIFDEEREWLIHVYQDLGASGKISDDLLSMDYWSYPMLTEAMEQIDQAYEDIAEYQETDPERYQLLYDRITMESMQFRYLLIGAYGTNYDAEELLNMKNLFKHDFERLGLITYAENRDIAQLWSDWGIK